uniref:Uncharacterized protein n=1 Tax=Anguilla anguilla TaxID=7936 RepID=A0A0E9R309_ANGAN
MDFSIIAQYQSSDILYMHCKIILQKYVMLKYVPCRGCIHFL